jgi:hypothetical protein
MEDVSKKTKDKRQKTKDKRQKTKDKRQKTKDKRQKTKDQRLNQKSHLITILMEFIKKYRVVILIVSIILVLVIIRSSGLNHFKNDAKKWAGPSLQQSNTIAIEQSGTLQGQKLIINLDKNTSLAAGIINEAHNIPPDSLLTKKYRNTILKHKGPVLLYSTEPGISARVWMILSQMGNKNIYILTDNTDNEVLKYNFRPDSLSAK